MTGSAPGRLEAPYERVVLVCTRGPWCQRDGSREVRAVMKQAVKEAGLRDACRVAETGCLRQCGRGPMVAVYPDGVWYQGVEVADARRIVGEHLVNGRVVGAVRYRPPRAGNNKLPHTRQ